MTTQIHAYLVAGNCKLDSNMDLNFATDMKHPFKLIMQQSYCDAEKKLYQLIIPEEE